MSLLVHIPRRRLAILIVLYAVLYAALARALPWYLFVPVGVALAVIHAWVEARHAGERYQSILDSVRRVHGEVLGDISRIDPSDVDRAIYKAFKELATELERRNFQLVEKNIQLLSIKEIGLSLVSSLDESKVVDAVINFLVKGLGYREVFLAILEHETFTLHVYTFRDAVGGQHFERTDVPLDRLDGILRKAALMQQPVLIRDPAIHPPGTIGDRPLFEDSTMTSYVIVPLVKSGATRDCDRMEDCLLHISQVRREAVGLEHHYHCPACGRVPLLGLIGVTDGFKANSLSRVDQVSVETLAVQLGAMLENNQLFAELRQEEAFRENVINSMMNGLLTVDREGRIVLANRRAGELGGYRDGELVGRTVDQVLAAGSGGGGPVREALASGREGVLAEAMLVRRDGGRIPVVVNTSFLRDPRGGVEGAIAVFDDISRIRRMEERLAQLDKLAALGRLSSSIAHEIRNPLAGIAAGIQYLQRTGELPDDQQENVRFILEEVDRIDRLIGDLMDVVRISDLIYERIDLAGLVRTGIRSVESEAAERGVTFHTRLPDDGAAVEADRDRITQVIINLVKNAVEASRKGGVVEVEVDVPERRGQSVDALRHFAMIRVRDHGPGLSDEDRERVFEPFFSRKPEGTGLGLYVVHSIVERHGGYIDVESTPGEGATFTVWLPTRKARHGQAGDTARHPSR